MMHKKIAITLPADLLGRLEKERGKTHLNRSAYFVEAVKCFMGIDSSVDDKLDKKYEAIYKELNKENKTIAKEMMSIASETIPED